MFLDNYHHLKKNEIYTLFLLVLFSIFARIPAIFIFGDTNLDNEWGVLVNNLINQLHLNIFENNTGKTNLIEFALKGSNINFSLDQN